MLGINGWIGTLSEVSTNIALLILLILRVLAPRNDSTTLDFMCACQTYVLLSSWLSLSNCQNNHLIYFRYQRRGVTASPADATPREVICYGIASVFTPVAKRGHGYASHMMRLLHWVLAPVSALPSFPAEWGTSPPDGPHDAQFSVLYSDIGSVFYDNCGPSPGVKTGWETLSPVNTTWEVGRKDARLTLNREEWSWLTEEQACREWEEDSQLMTAEILSIAKSTGKIAYSYLPNGGVGQFNIRRCMSFTPDLKPVLAETWGVKRTTTDGRLIFATWTFEMGTKAIVLTRLRATETEFPSLLEMIKEAARSLDKDTIETWNLPDALKLAGERTGGRTSERSDHLSAVKWYGPEATDQLVWSFNEKYVSEFLPSILSADSLVDFPGVNRIIV